MFRNATVIMLVCLWASTSTAYPFPGLKIKRVDGKFLIMDPVISKTAAVPGPPRSIFNHVPEPRERLPLDQPDSLAGFDAVFNHRVTRQFRPENAIVRHYSSGKGTFEPIAGEEYQTKLTDKAWEAIALAPDWIRVEMTSNISLLPHELQDKLADLMLNVEDPLFLDEIAFLVANTAAYDLVHENFRPGYITDQVKYLYKAAPLLEYVTLKEVGTPGEGDYWTTTVYTYMDEGQLKQWELPREYYYWWILHPRLDAEPLIDINPATGEWDEYPKALTFREYFMFPPEGAEPYMTHYIFRTPPKYEIYDGMEEVPFDSLNNWGPSQQGAFTPWAIGPMYLTMDSQGRPTTIEFKQRGKGIVLATTLLVEQAYAQGKSDLLRNMLRYGAGNVVMKPLFKHIVVMEQAPFGYEGVIEDILDEYGVDFEIVDSDWLYEADLEELAIRKIIIPSDQPLAVYQAVADNREKLEQWVKGQWRIIEFHGAVADPAADWSGLIMPGGFSAQGVADQPDDAVEVEGQPPLAKYLADTTHVWDLVQYPGLTGDRPWDPAMFAYDKIGWWASQNIFDSFVDFAEKHNWIPGPAFERTSYANRLLYNHYGNCGENQDLFTAATRTALLPINNTSNGTEDHVWSEFYFLEDWHTYQMGWADGPTDIDTPGISSGKKWGGGKNIAFVTGYRGDGLAINRTDYYHPTAKLKLHVVDKAGMPVQGATVFVVTESYYKMDGSYPLMIAFWGITGDDGSATFELGANVEEDLSLCTSNEVELRCNNYYVRVFSDKGDFPAEEGTVDLVVNYLEAVKDNEKEMTVTVDGEFVQKRPGDVVESPLQTPDRVLSLSVDTLEELACGYGPHTGPFCDMKGPGTLDFYLLDYANMGKFKAGEPFDALAMAEGVEEGFQFNANAPKYGDWFFVLVHQSHMQYHQLVDASFQVFDRTPEPPVDQDGEDDVVTQDDSEEPAPQADSLEEALPSGDDIVDDTPGKKKKDGCSAGPDSGGDPFAGLVLILLVAVLAAGRRRRLPA